MDALSPRNARSLSLTLLHLTSDKQEGEACGKATAAAEKTKKTRGKTPTGKLDELEGGHHPFQEKEPLKAWPGGVHPGNTVIIRNLNARIPRHLNMEQQNCLVF